MSPWAGIEDHALAAAVARYKLMFFGEKAADGTWIDYELAISGQLQLVPGGEARRALAGDYRRMIEDGLLAKAPEPFDALMDLCAEIARRANQSLSSGNH